jgi:hypothetical protein
MKTRTLTLLYTAILASLLTGAFVITTITAQTEKKLYYFWYPYSYCLDQAPAEPWNAYVFGVSGARVRDINKATIKLEGLYSPTSTKLILWNLIMIMSFSGYDVVEALGSKLPHLGPGNYRVYVDITGLLNNGTPFRGSASISVTVPEPPPPPPP